MVTAVLTAPQMEVTAVGDGLQVSFDKLPVIAIIRVIVWRKGDELKVRRFFLHLPLPASCSVIPPGRRSSFKEVIGVISCPAQAVVHTMPAEQRMLDVTGLQEGAEYCIRAQTVLSTQLHSSSTDTQCVSISGMAVRHSLKLVRVQKGLMGSRTSDVPSGLDAAWRWPTAVTVTAVIMAGLLGAVFWSVVYCCPDAGPTYLQKEPLPRPLVSHF